MMRERKLRIPKKRSKIDRVVTDYCISVQQMVHMPLVVLDEDLRVRCANRVFYDTFRLSRRKTAGTDRFGSGRPHTWTDYVVVRKDRAVKKRIC